MLRRLIPLIIFLLGVGVIHGQSSTPEPDVKWWWAWRAADHSVIAFDADGDTHVIATPDKVLEFDRISDDTALAVLQTGDQFALDKVMSVSVVPLLSPINGRLYQNVSAFYPLEIQWPYAVISTLGEKLAVINFNDNTVASLDRSLITTTCAGIMGGPPYPLENCVRFSADGLYLRYIAAPTSAEPHTLLVLRERDLASGEEHNFYTVPRLDDAQDNVQYDSARCEGGDYGVNWLCHRESDFAGYDLYSDWVVDPTGQTHTLLEQTLFSYRWDMLFSNHSLIVRDMRCQQNCSIDTYGQNGIPSRSYMLPDGSANFYTVIQLPGGNLYLEGAGEEAFILTPDGHLQELGNVYCCEEIDTKSPDLHWVVLATDNYTTETVWDLQTNQVKLVLPASDLPDVTYTDSGFILRSEATGVNDVIDTWVYFNDTDKLLKIPQSIGGFTDMLPDDTLLYEQSEAGEGRASGIYHYDPAAKTYTLLVPDATLQIGY